MKKKVKSIIIQLLIMILVLVIATLIGWLFRAIDFPETNIVILYLLSVLIIARLTNGFIYGISASIIGTFAFNYFFTEPYYTLRVDNSTYLITFAIMIITSLTTSALTTRVKQNAVIAQEKENETSALYRLTNHLTDAKDIEDIASIATMTISKSIGCLAGFLAFDENGVPEKSFIQQKNENEQIHRVVEDGPTLKRRIENLRTPYDIGPEFNDWPIYGRDTILGIVRIPNASAEELTESRTRLLRSMIESVELAMDRFYSTKQRIKSNEEITQERYRANLLRAISHDLRTPLSGIMGTSEMLLGMTDKTDNRYDLIDSIYKDSDWLHSLVENILNLTRLQEGKLVIHKQLEAIEEVISVALGVISKRAPRYEFIVNIPDTLLLVPMDAKLIVQVLVNIMDNSIKHTGERKEIIVTVEESQDDKFAIFSIKDFGSGIAPEDLPKIFQMFYTTHGKSADSKRGIGLGLTICETIVKAHGGSITAQNRQDTTGAEFIFTLPLEGNNVTE